MFTTDNKDLLNGLIKIAVKLKGNPSDPIVKAVGQQMMEPHALKLGITVDKLITDLVAGRYQFTTT